MCLSHFESDKSQLGDEDEITSVGSSSSEQHHTSSDDELPQSCGVNIHKVGASSLRKRKFRDDVDDDNNDTGDDDEAVSYSQRKGSFSFSQNKKSKFSEEKESANFTNNHDVVFQELFKLQQELQHMRTTMLSAVQELQETKKELATTKDELKDTRAVLSETLNKLEQFISSESDRQRNKLLVTLATEMMQKIV